MRFSFQLSRKWRERLNRWTGGTLTYILYPYFMLVNAVSWFVALLIQSWHSRHFRYLVQGFPALFATAILILAGVFAATGRAQERRSNLAKDYLGQAGECLNRARNYTGMTDADKAKRRELLGTARTFVEKALALEGGDRDDYKFHLATILLQMGDVEHCRAIMYKLAPDDANGYPHAHLWRGQMLREEFGLRSPIATTAIERHYTRAYESSKNDPDSQAMYASAFSLANFFMVQRKYKEALPYLEKVEEKYAAQRLALGHVYQALGRPKDAQKMFQSAEKHFRDKTAQKLDDKESRWQWGMALMAQEKYPEVVEAMHKGVVMTQDMDFLQMVSEAYRLWELKLNQDPASRLDVRLELIQKGIQTWPKNTGLLARLHAISTTKTPEGEKAKQEIEKMIGDGKGPQAPILYHILGDYAFNQGRLEEARRYWEMCYDLDQAFALAGNNLAWMLIHDEKSPDVDRALEMIDKIIAKYPNFPNFHGTRGEARTKKKQYKEALPDLQKALAAQPDDLTLNQSIAECYEALGDRGLAEIHRKKVADLKEKNAKRIIEAPPAPTLPDATKDATPESPVKPPIKDKVSEKPPGR